MSMNVWTAVGQKVRYANPNAGYDYDQENCRTHLTLGEVYTLEYRETGNFHTSIRLKEVPGVYFNSVNFDNVTD